MARPAAPGTTRRCPVAGPRRPTVARRRSVQLAAARACRRRRRRPFPPSRWPERQLTFPVGAGEVHRNPWLQGSASAASAWRQGRRVVDVRPGAERWPIGWGRSAKESDHPARALRLREDVLSAPSSFPPQKLAESRRPVRQAVLVEQQVARPCPSLSTYGAEIIGTRPSGQRAPRRRQPFNAVALPPAPDR